MPAYMCKCRTRVSVGRIPCDHQWNFMSDVELDRYEDKADVEELYKEMKEFFKCPSCERLAMFWDGWDSNPTFYIEDN
ncbi:hypothetical protein [Aliikangiella coralliicola]|uniref:Uncharacterized protein n=1 Tax=Aliikangiella coralliicola TaxID=2592383 RepID=A0A545UFN8_9GAMM|nr:hypothetical protein [Aliikangiella coralliicola]TQV88292.1 hypothetical protein FLL46_07120 [Aliikangiella coralliicola]